jgi:hypothetical protein
MLSGHARRFFEVEIRNKYIGGVSPATLGSALDSAAQAPEDVMADWIGAGGQRRGRKAVAELRSGLEFLRDQFGNGFRLRELSDLPDLDALRFTCPSCGRHELEEIQTTSSSSRESWGV